ncbi:hypothetical protein J3R82DRAFT_7662 [Butyriboletus roseoflavus]|nr:hypothetical protein J3R82DRAFT_7662 [Butyriboletus roseoflavus]
MQQKQNQDAGELVAIGLGLKQYRCEWMTNGRACGALVQGHDVPLHLKMIHQVNATARLVCLWGKLR